MSLQETDDTQNRVAPQGLNTGSIYGVRAGYRESSRNTAVTLVLVPVGCCHPSSHNLGGKQQLACTSPRLWVDWRSAGSAGSSASSWCPAGPGFSADQALGCSTWVHSRAQTEEAAVPRGRSSHGDGRGPKKAHRNTRCF